MGGSTGRCGMATSDTWFGAALDDLVARTDEAFHVVQRRIFADDDAVNRNLVVEVTDAALVREVPTLVLITPWRITGLIVPSDGDGPRELLVAGGLRPAHRGDVAPLGVYWAVTLVPDVSRLAGS